MKDPWTEMTDAGLREEYAADAVKHAKMRERGWRGAIAIPWQLYERLLKHGAHLDEHVRTKPILPPLETQPGQPNVKGYQGKHRKSARKCGAVYPCMPGRGRKCTGCSEDDE